MVVLDTHVLIHDALAPARLSRRAKRLLDTQPLACSDISLWEIGMLVSKGRVAIEADTEQFLEDIIRARNLRVLPITPGSLRSRNHRNSVMQIPRTGLLPQPRSRTARAS